MAAGTPVVKADEVLWDRSDVAKRTLFRRERWAMYHYERQDGEKGDHYVLASLVVPAGSWQVTEITTWFRHYAGSAPERGWENVDKARLNFVPVEKQVPSAEYDPRSGRVVPVSVVRQTGDVVEITATGLNLELAPGAYWIGLTPLVNIKQHGQFFSLLTKGPLRTGVEPVVKQLGVSDRDEGWATYHLANYRSVPCNRNFSLRLSGTRKPDGVVNAAPQTSRKVDHSTMLRLRYGVFDPLKEPPQIPRDRAGDDACRLWLVQLRHAPTAGVRDTLREREVEILGYVPDNSYLVAMGPENRELVAALPEVRWVGAWHPAYRIDPSISGEDISRANLKPFHAPDDFAWKNCVLRTPVDDADTKRTIAKAVEDLGGRVLARNDQGFQFIATLRDEDIRRLAQRNDVLYIERYGNWFSGQPRGDGAAAENRSNVLGMAQLRTVLGADYIQALGDFRGAGVRCAVIDSPPRDSHVDLFERVSYVGKKRTMGHWHGTSVCGILIGDGTASSQGVGLMPKGHVLFQDSQFVHQVDRYAVTDASLRRGAVVQSDSSGTYDVRWHDVLTAELDDVVARYDLLYCKAAANTGSRFGKAWGKNVITVGGIEHNGTLEPSEFTPWRGSARGPAPDGRIKPDLVAFAQDVLTAGSANDRDYDLFAGTSCATPIVAGCSGLLVEMWAQGVFTPRPLGVSIADRKPHAATAKALLINSAHQFPFSEGQDGFHRFNQGWGMPDLRKLYDLRNCMFVVNADRPLRERQAVTYRLKSDGNQPLRFTLTWTDPPALRGTTQALVNDLDLDVTSPDGTLFHGNHGLLTGLWSESGGAPDQLNNVEQIRIEAPQAGNWTCRVSAPRVAMDQDRSSAAFDQRFAFVATGIVEDAER